MCYCNAANCNLTVGATSFSLMPLFLVNETVSVFYGKKFYVHVHIFFAILFAKNLFRVPAYDSCFSRHYWHFVLGSNLRNSAKSFFAGSCSFGEFYPFFVNVLLLS